MKCRRLLSALLVAVMILSSIPLSAISVIAATGSETKISVNDTFAASGTEVSVDVIIENNPGILGMTLKLEYDDEYATLMSVVNGEALSAMTFTAPKSLQSGCNLQWDAEFVDDEDIIDGVVATLTFEISEEAPSNKEIAISLSYDNGAIIDNDLNPISVSLSSGTIKILDYTPGDLNGDGTINSTDVVYLRRYIAGYDITIKEAAGDVNDDGLLNSTDVVFIRRFIAGYDIQLKPSTPKCQHVMTATEAKAASCTEDGNIAYWYCEDCNNYFSDANGHTKIEIEETVIEATGHTPVVDLPKAPTKTETGLTEGSHCSACKEVIVPQQILPVLTSYAVTYNIATGNSASYIAAQGLDLTIDDDKRSYISQEGLIELPVLSIDGYQFLGWYTEAPENNNAVQVTSIPVGSTGNYTLYAHWHEYTYDITYKLYQTPLGEITNEEYLHYTVSKGKVDLPNPELHNYVFIGWYTDDGVEMTKIPVGTTGDLTLNAYWTSKRNLTKVVKKLEDPIIIENSDDGVIYFTYELGTIENVPLSDAIWTIQSVSGLAQQVSKTVSTQISEEQAKNIAETISNSTVDSGSWTLSKDWNDVTEVNEEWAEQNGLTQEEANTQTKSSSGTYSVTDSTGGTKTKTTTDGTTTVDYNSQNYTHGNSAEFNAKVSGSYSNKGNLSSAIAGTYEVSAEISGGYEQHQETNEHTGTDTTTVDTTVKSGTATFNKASTSTNTQSASESVTVKNAISQIISNTKGYGKSYSSGGANSESQGFSSTDSKSVNTSSTLTYFTSKTETTTTTYSTDGKNEGCYRLVVAGTIHVFGVVGYDVATKSYFAYTFNVLDDKTYEFLDYSPTLSFDDYENGAIPFEIPYFVHEYVIDKTVMTDGLIFKTNTTNGTATVVAYDGADSDITIPSYFTSGNVAYKVNALSASAFAGKNVRSVVLSDYITELPDGAFKNCAQLEEISGYFTKIGAEAFSGCAKLNKYNITSSIVKIGENAFAGVEEIYVNAIDKESALAEANKKYPNLDDGELLICAKSITQDVIDSAINSGADNIMLNISNVIDNIGLTLNVPAITSFELQGGLKEYKDLKLNSDAETTTIKDITIHNSKQIPLEISSKVLKLDAATIEGNGFVLLLNADTPTVSLTRDSRLISVEKEAVVWKNPSISSSVVDNAVGTLDITGNIYVCGDIEGKDYINVESGAIISISESEFENYIKGIYTVTFNANGGQVSMIDKTVFYGSQFGELPIPTLDYHTFDGWFTENGTEVTADTIMTEAKDIVLNAHWTQNDASGWVLESEVPSDAEIVNEKWTYDLTTKITSSSNNVSGYNLYDATWVWSNYGHWTNWSSSAVESSDSREVETKKVVDRASYTQWNIYYYRYWNTTYGAYYYTFSSAYGGTLYQRSLPESSLAFSKYASGRDAYIIINEADRNFRGELWFVSSTETIPEIAHTEYRYRERTKIYTYYHSKTEAKESFSQVTPSDSISNVQHWVQYRAK